MNTYELELQRSMTHEQRLIFQSEYHSRRKDPVVGVLLALFLGGFGAHHFYMGRYGLGALYLIFCWTLIPSLIALIECFLMPGRIERWNANLAADIAGKVQLLQSRLDGPALPLLPGTVYCTKCGTAMVNSARFCPHCGVPATAPVAG